MDHSQVLDRYAAELGSCLDIRSGFLEKLVAEDVITYEQKCRINDDISALIQLLRSTTPQDFETFLEKLKEADQCHVYNLLMNTADDNRPLTRDELRMFDRCTAQLVNVLSIMDDLLIKLVAYGCINGVHNDRIRSRSLDSHYDAVQELIGVLRRRGRRDFQSFARALVETNQAHVVSILKEFGVIVDVKVNAGSVETEDALLQDLVRIIQRRQYTIDDAPVFTRNLRNLLANHVIGANKGCICISLFCPDSEATREILQYVYYGNFRADFEKWAVSQMIDIEVRITIEPMTEIQRFLMTSSTDRVSVDIITPDSKSEENMTKTVADHVEVLNQFTSRLIHCLDIDNGLLEKLVAVKVITHPEKLQIIKDNSNPIDVLVELLKTKSKEVFETFLEKLKNDDQRHVYNLLMGIDDDNDRPLTESELEKFDQCVIDLIDELDTKNGLLNNLCAYRCINKVHSQRIERTKSDYKGAQKLLDILRMRSLRDFRSFAKALKETNQEHLVGVLKQHGVIVDVKVHAENAENRVLALLRETLAIVQRDGVIVHSASDFKDDLQHLFSNHVIGVNDGCICISLFCADSDTTRKVLRYVYQGSFRVDLERWATSRLLGAEVRITIEPMTELHRSLLTSCTVRLDVELDSPTRAQTLRQTYKAARSTVVLHSSSAPDARLQISGMKTDGTSSLQLLVHCQSHEDENTLNVMHSDGSLKAAVRQILTELTIGKPVGEFHVAIRNCWLSTNPQSLPAEMLDLILFKTARRIFLRCPLNKRFLRTNERDVYGTVASVCHHWRNSLNDKWIRRRFRGVYNEYIRQRIENRRPDVRDCLSLSDEKLMNLLQKATKVTQLQMDAIKSATNNAQQCDELLAAVHRNRKCRQLLRVLAESDQSNVHALILSESISKLIVETKESTPHDEIAKNLNSALRYLRHESQQTTKSLDDSSSSSSGDGGGKTQLPIVDETLSSLRVFVNDLKPAKLLYVRPVNDGSLEILVGCHPAKESQTGLFEAYDRSEEDRKLKSMLNSIFDSLLKKMSAPPSKRRLSIARVKLDKDSFEGLSSYRRESRKRKQLQHTFSSVDDTEMGMQLKREHTLTPSSEETMTDVTGLAYLDGRLFIAHRSSTTLTVRDARSPDDVVDSVRLPEGCHLYDIVACPKSNCLYISDSRPNNGCIWKISADGGSCTAWSTSVRHPRGLSVSADGSLLVVSEAPHRVVYIFRASDNEKSTCDGDRSPSKLLDLPADIDSPRRALQLSNGNIVVCFGGADHAAENQGVCLLSESGDRLMSLLSKKIIKPYIELDKKERIIIADDRNNRVIRVTVPTIPIVPTVPTVPTTETDETLAEILVSFNAAATAEKRSGPCRVCLATDDNDAGLSRLFVGLRDGTVLAFRYVDESDMSSSSSSSSLFPVDKETVA